MFGTKSSLIIKWTQWWALGTTWCHHKVLLYKWYVYSGDNSLSWALWRLVHGSLVLLNCGFGLHQFLHQKYGFWSDSLKIWHLTVFSVWKENIFLLHIFTHMQARVRTHIHTIADSNNLIYTFSSRFFSETTYLHHHDNQKHSAES